MANITTESPVEEAHKPPPAVVRSAQRRSQPVSQPDTNPAIAHLPRPPRFSMIPNQFFEYWEEVDRVNPNRVYAYVYRTWPVIDRQQIDPDAFKYVDKMDAAFPEPAMWRQEMLHRYGSGNYKLILNDGAINKSVGQTMVTDLRDPEYPPVINNLDELVMDDPSNQSYIEQLRQKGIIPGENEMANQEAMATMAGTIKDLAKQAADKPAALPPQQPQTASDATKEAVAMAREVFKDGMEMGKAAISAEADAKVRAVEAQLKAADPMTSFETLSKLLTMVKELQPAPAAPAGGGSTAELTNLVNSFMTRESNLQGKIMEILQAQIAAMELRQQATNQAQTQAQPAAAKDDLITSLEKLANMKEKLQVLFGGGEPEEREEKVPVWMQLGQSALAGLPALATAIVAMSYNLAIAKTGQGVPIPPGPAPEAPALPGNDQPNLPPGEDMKASAAVYANVLRQLEEPLLRHLNDPNLTGVDFADALMKFKGKLAYDSIRELGKDTILALLQSYPPIAQVITPIPERISLFLDEFLDAERILADEEEGNEDGQEPGQIIDIKPVPEKGKRGAKATTT